jgi:precorrin-2 methylase
MEGVYSIAWHKDWAILKEGNKLLHKFGREVGNIIDGSPVLYDEYIHLQESLEESMSC